jgi:hypothetical protein
MTTEAAKLLSLLDATHGDLTHHQLAGLLADAMAQAGITEAQLKRAVALLKASLAS